MGIRKFAMGIQESDEVELGGGAVWAEMGK